jgi:hypothetical protein
MEEELFNKNLTQYLEFGNAIGFNEDTACVFALAKTSLMQSVLKLARFNQGHPAADDHDRMICIFGILSVLLNSDPDMMQEWENMIAALSSTSIREDESIDLILEAVELSEGGIVSVALLDALKMLRCPSLTISGPINGVKFAIDALKVNSTMHALGIIGTEANNPFESKEVVMAFAEKVINNPSLKVLILGDCNMGKHTFLMPALAPILNHIEYFSLEGSNIGEQGATIVATLLASNPGVKHLLLMRNNLKDGDAQNLRYC